MKHLIITALLLTGFAANAVDVDDIYKCELTVKRVGEMDIKLSGNLIAADVMAGDEITYLTLQPISSLDLEFEARILLTVWDYNPMSIHPRGDTVKAVAFGDIEGERSEISHVADNGNVYNLVCSLRN